MLSNRSWLDQAPIVHIEDDIDDHQLIQEAIKATSIPNPILFFRDGQQALNYLRTTTEQPLIILCDVRMPGMDGFELRDRIDADPHVREKAIPFVFFSTWASRELVERAYKGTIQGYHLKGKSFDDLKSELDMIVTYWKNCLHPKSF